MDRKEAIEVVRKKVDYYEADKRLKAALEALIPELAESEDEKIIEDAIQIIRESRRQCAEYGPEADKHLKAIAYLEKQKEQKPADWTDADEKILKRIIDRQKFIIPVPGKDPGGVVFERREDTEAINWLKRRVTSQPQPKQEWSKEDEEVFKHLCDYLENERDTAITKFDKASFAEFVQ